MRRAAGDQLPPNTPLYLTLCGPEARDIKLLIERGLISRTEVGGIAEEDLHKIVAVEKDPESVLLLQRQLPGLKIIERPLQDFLRLGSMLAWPDRTDRNTCRAKVVNLDFEQSMEARVDQEQTTFPVIRLIEKLGRLHAERPQIDWTLCLTLNSTISWSAEISAGVQSFLAENFRADSTFASGCRSFLGESLYDGILSSDALDFSELSVDLQQRVLMAFVPKQISHSVLGQGWRVETERNLRYGGQQHHAPMVSWIFNLVWDSRATSQPSALYAESLARILSGAGKVDDDGSIS